MSAWPSAELRAALLRSLAAAVDGSLLAWLRARRSSSGARVDRITYAELRGWSLTDDRRALVHASGRFFAIVGLEVELDRGHARERLTTPLVSQSEHGLLGVLMRVHEGRAELLVQAKFEPGDPYGAQLAPTVQATQSNYTRVHGGRRPPGLDRFLSAPAADVLLDVLAPEQAELFLAKQNRNMLVRVDAAPELADDPRFRWTTLAELGAALRVANTVNMSLRSVVAGLVCMLLAGAEPRVPELGVGWSRRAVVHPLDRLPGWTWTARELSPIPPHRGPSVVHVRVEASEREVPSWTQPMLTRASVAPITLYLRRRRGQTELRVRVSLGPGQTGGARLGPSAGPEPELDPPPSSTLVGARVLFDGELAEDGGRSFALRHRYRVVELALGSELSERPNQLWLPVTQLGECLRRGLLDVELRTCVLALVLADPTVTAPG